MARKKSARDELFETLRARGLRQRAARVVSDAVGAGRGGGRKSQSAAMGVDADLRKVADDIEGRLTGSTKRKEAAKKPAKTRARKADARSTAAKKAAATRRKNASTTSRRKSASSTTRRKTTKS